MGASRVHHCISQWLIAKDLAEPPAKKCRCRQFISSDKAEEMVKRGEALWVVKEHIRGTREETCRLCHGDPQVKNCAFCGGKGTVEVNASADIRTYDIVLANNEAADKKDKKQRPGLMMKTPRVATIESKHIWRAYGDALIAGRWVGSNEARDRIEEYGRMARESLAELVVGFEPDDDPKKGQGRKYDFGRSI